MVATAGTAAAGGYTYRWEITDWRYYNERTPEDVWIVMSGFYQVSENFDRELYGYGINIRLSGVSSMGVNFQAISMFTG